MTILRHNVQTWNNKRHTLTNIYNQTHPDIILLNETSTRDGDKLKILNYNVFTTNRRNELEAGAAIAACKDITARIDDDFYQDFLTATVQTTHGPVTIATGYIPPRQPYINTINLNKIFSHDEPTYLIGDLNAYHRTFGYNTNNLRGQQIVTLIDTDKCRHIGPFLKPE